VEGHPFIIANSKMHYSVNPGDTFHTDRGKIHAIFNPTNEWVAIEETYTGKFEEEDILRIFNPNHYH
jgi:mannose-6-phosphate isomerase-like protein (cupin superfamily)